MNSNPLLLAVNKWWPTIVILMVVGGIIGLGATAITRPTYSATSSVYFSPGYAVSATDLNQSSAYVLSQMPSYIVLAQSDAVLTPSVIELGSDRSTGSLAATLSVSNPQDSAVVRITASDGSARQSARIANVVAENLADRVTDLTPRVSTAAPVEPVVATRVGSAATPGSPASPNSLRNVVEGLLVGLIIGVLIVLIRQAADRRVGSVTMLRTIVAAPLLGVIARKGRTRGVTPRDHGDDLVHLAIGIRSLMREDSSRFLVSSSTPGEGVTTLAAGAGGALTRAGVPTVVVEANVRHPSLKSFAEVPDAATLVDVLSGTADVDAAVRHSDKLGVDVLPAAAFEGDPTALLSSSAMGDLLDELRDRYRIVLIDTAAIDGTADASILAAASDGVILVVDATKAKDDDVASASDIVSASGGTIVGTVLNRADGHHRRVYPVGRPQSREA